MTTLYTSLAEIQNFGPCLPGWERILKAQKITASYYEPITLASCVESNTTSDVCWLLGNRKVEIAIAVSFARKCVQSVENLSNLFVDKVKRSANTAAACADRAAAYTADATKADTAYIAAVNAADATHATVEAARYAGIAAKYAGIAAKYAGIAAMDATYAYAGSDSIFMASAAAYAAAALKTQYAKNKQLLLDAIREYEEAH